MGTYCVQAAGLDGGEFRDKEVYDWEGHPRSDTTACPLGLAEVTIVCSPIAKKDKLSL